MIQFLIKQIEAVWPQHIRIKRPIFIQLTSLLTTSILCKGTNTIAFLIERPSISLHVFAKSSRKCTAQRKLFSFSFTPIAKISTLLSMKTR